MPSGKAHFGTLICFSKATQNWMDAPQFLEPKAHEKQLRADPCSKQKLVPVSYLSTSKSALHCFTEHKKMFLESVEFYFQMDVTKEK